jgi:DNA repair protein RecN (Recombination protein N)
MLSSLTIQDFVIVDSLELQFDAGMSVLSGETGAGKSILIDALSLCLGARAEASQVREGCERANITAVFDLTPEAKAILEEQSIACEDQELHLRRAIDSSGRSKAYVNGTPVPVSLLKLLSETLIDIHGQHAFQTLAKPEEQLRLLDDYGQLHPLRKPVQTAYQTLRNIEKQLQLAQQNQEERTSRMENLQWKLDLLQKLSPQAGAWEQLNADFDRLSHGAELIEGTRYAVERLADGELSILDELSQLIDRMSQLSTRDPVLESVVSHLSEGEILLREASYELGHYLKHADLDPDSLREAEQRLSDWHDTARKLRLPPEALRDEWLQVEAEMNGLSTGFDVEKLQAEHAQAQTAYEQAAQRLSEARQQTAEDLSEKITESMQTLSMQGGLFAVHITPSAPSAQGSDLIEFRVAGHPGVSPQAIQKVASGGELARISLAITVNTVQSTPVPTLIFDEVDSGIGGAVAETVGKYLRTLSTNKQVLCVTHLPQVAAQGHQHFRVSKHIEAGKTKSQITALPYEQRVDEIARMLGGQVISEATRTAAREMIEGSES